MKRCEICGKELDVLGRTWKCKDNCQEALHNAWMYFAYLTEDQKVRFLEMLSEQ